MSSTLFGLHIREQNRKVSLSRQPELASQTNAVRASTHAEERKDFLSFVSLKIFLQIPPVIPSHQCVGKCACVSPLCTVSSQLSSGRIGALSNLWLARLFIAGPEWNPGLDTVYLNGGCYIRGVWPQSS